MTPDELHKLLGVATSTIRAWTGEKHFGEYFAEGTRAKGSRRYFDDQDARILALIVTLKAEQMSVDDIHATLKRYQADDWRGLPELPPAPPGTGPISMIPREAAETRIDVERKALLREIGTLQSEIERLKGELEDERENRESVVSELSEAYRKLGELEGRLSERYSTATWLKVSAGVAVAVLIVAAIVIILLLAVNSGGG